MKIISPEKSHISALFALWKEAFGDTDEFLDTFFKTAFCPGRCKCILSDDKAIAALYWFDCEYAGKPVAYIYAVATAQKYRGCGLGHEIMSFTHTHLTNLGYEGTILVPGNRELFGFYQDLGYETCCTHDEFICAIPNDTVFSPDHTASGSPFAITPITKENYACLRRKFLPHGSVIQENENLIFLDAFCTFYAGEDFLLAGSLETDATGICTFHCPEILGNISTVPQILHTLGCKTGRFRVPCNTVAYADISGIEASCLEIPFAMYKKLGNSTLTPPSYFGFAFD